ncbi:probable calcium-binding protein CML27 [Eucalyptus grandis]|uniref:probable calcium-binding protein CML27 n=1 Tax=Eucalyptus grandis TaxID=71139 RepID=UPI00192E9391|nr:probable calcium-binding protein CML27 [Eucalyptus grandis]
MATPPTPTQAPTPAAAAAAAAAPPHLPHMTDEELRKVFDQFDANGDGKISAAELSQVLAAMGSAVPPEDLDRAMAEIDADGDGFISLPEFAGLCRSGPSPDADLRDAFDLYDQDRNGLISAAELHLVLNRLSMNCSVEDCARMIKSVDGDGDGNVNFEEFRKMMASKGPGN